MKLTLQLCKCLKHHILLKKAQNLSEIAIFVFIFI